MLVNGGLGVLGEADIDSIHMGSDISGAQLVFASVSTITVGAAGVDSRLRNSTNTNTMQFSGTLLGNMAIVGAGGRDAGAEAASTWYAVHIIGDSTGINSPAALLSTSATAPVMPIGYDIFRRVGWVRNSSLSDIIDFVAIGAGRTRIYNWLSTITNRQFLSAGSAQIATSVSLANLVPPTSTLGLIGVRQLGTPPAFIYRDVGGQILNGLLAGNHLCYYFPLTTAQAMAYLNFGAGGLVDIFLHGYVDVI